MHLDLRVQAMPIPALLRWLRETATLGFNTLLIEWEATFPFVSHPLISSGAAYSPRDVRRFVAEATRLGVDVIPLQQCFGHVEYILRHERYAPLRESSSDLCQLCPCKGDEALDVFGALFAELAAAHPAPFIHIGGDETYLLGHCPRCRAKAEKHGASRLYVDYFKRVAQLVVQLGKRPLLWADMLLKHPEAASAMPRECVFIDWNYGWPADRFGDLSKLDRSRYEIWGAPALRSGPDNHSLTSWKTHFENLRDFIPHGRRAGHAGMILTSWSTSGIYGYNWEAPGEVIELLPVRRVYPLAGFRILVAAFHAALETGDAFEPRAFVADYARSRFGLTARDGAALWLALTQDATPAGSAENPAAVHRASRRAKSLLDGLRPKKNRREFEHLRLMTDLREFHLRFKVLEKKLHSPGFTARRLTSARAAVGALLVESRGLERRFVRLNRGELLPAEFPAEHAFRFGRLRELHARLCRPVA